MRLILDGTVVRVRLDRRATSISLLVALGVRADGKKVLLAIRSMGGESEGAWRALLDDLIKRGLRAEDAGFWSSPTARRAWKRRWRRGGPTRRSSAARFKNTAISWLTRPSGCTRKSRTTIAT